MMGRTAKPQQTPRRHFPACSNAHSLTPNLLLGALLLLFNSVDAVCPSCQVVVRGALRVQALSPSLLRVEPLGPNGFEDRETFMVANRTFPGVPASAHDTERGSNITTAFYSVLVRLDGSFLVHGLQGHSVYDSATSHASNLLRWPSPLTAAAYTLEDRPRFVVPRWAPEPAPAGAPQEATSGYDFRNSISGDVYIFLLGTTLADWWASRGEFLRLTGPTPLLPNYAYGTWFTTWRQFTEQDTKTAIGNWDSGGFPLDVWGLDMNWRLTNGSQLGAPACRDQRSTDRTCEDHKYLSNLTDFPPQSNKLPFQGWFEWLNGKGLHSYFNDHPFPKAKATKPAETRFRWDSLTSFLSGGLTFWWFDHGWIFSIPPPFVPINDTSCYGKNPGPWQNLSSEVWGSHVYYETMRRFNSANRVGERPLALSRNGGPNWRPGMHNSLVNGVAAHHRYPVWWNGDGVPIEGSVESMVDEAVHDFRPFVHSDCGANEVSGTAVLRWTAHCVFGTILRFHGADHSPWLFDNSTQAVIRRYLQMRYALAPSVISSGATTQLNGLPLAARCDLFWPGHAPARSNHQYVSTFAAALIAPMTEEQTERSVWIPPGEWQDAWDGSVLVGPLITNVSKHYSQIPMWHQLGGLVVTTDSKALRIDDQDWHHLTLEAWPVTDSVRSVARELHLDNTHMSVTLGTDGNGGIRVQGSTGFASEGRPLAHAWHVRLHLAVGERLVSATLDGSTEVPIKHLGALESCAGHFPFGGVGSAPACAAGPIAEVEIPSTSLAWDLNASIASSPHLNINGNQL